MGPNGEQGLGGKSKKSLNNGGWTSAEFDSSEKERGGLGAFSLAIKSDRSWGRELSCESLSSRGEDGSGRDA